MSITILSVGKLREKPYRAMADEYLKRLSRFGKFAEVEVPDLAEPSMNSPALEQKVKEQEAEALLRMIPAGDYVIALTLQGAMPDSPALANKLGRLFVRGQSGITFVIGGSLGLGQALLDRADEQLCMSPMTFPHQLARVMLLEQLYRAMKIRAGERYHK